MVRASLLYSLIATVCAALHAPAFAQESSSDAAASETPAIETRSAESAAEEVSTPSKKLTAQNEEPADPAARAARIKDLLSLVRDNTLYNHKRENPAYFALVKEVLDQTPEQLRSQARENPRFNDFYKNPAEHRGEIVHLSINLRRVIPVDIAIDNEAGVSRLYELWGWTEEAKAWMYCCIVPELPSGFPTEGEIANRVELTGYFFKMQAYQPGGAAPNARNLVAPLVIGRIANAAPLPEPAAQGLGNWPLILIVGFGIIIVMRLMMNLRLFGRPAPTHRNYRRRSLEPIDTDSLSDSLSAPDKGVRIRNANEV